MQIQVIDTPLGRARDEAVVLFAGSGERISAKVTSAGREFSAGYQTLVSRKGFNGDAGQVRSLGIGHDARIPTLILVGLGGPERTSESLRHASASGVRLARELGARSVTLVAPEGRGAVYRPQALAEALAEGAVQGLYRFENYKESPSEQQIETISLLVTPKGAAASRRGALEGQVLGEAVCYARSLGNEPGNTATPTYLAESACQMAEELGLGVRILEEDEMRQLGMGALLGVSQGSAQPAKLIILTHEPKKARAETVAIVGKGLTFDTGGISIKPGAKMEDMKFDMCGGAAVLGAMRAAAQLDVGVRVVGLVPTSENMPGGNAYKPGDILRAMNGKTIEIRNTDAEGRLILADALAYATSKLRPKPKAVVDLATLTGACVVALGDQHAALVSNNEKLSEGLLQASEASGDALWRMPLNDGYRKQLESPYADLSNLGTPGAGTLTAAAFLENFTGSVPWAHLDIAGMAWTSRTNAFFTPGATGFGVRVLARWLQARGK
jgi:leucyl aminopeptidase